MLSMKIIELLVLNWGKLIMKDREYGLNSNGMKKENYLAGMSIFANYVVLAEGARGNNTLVLSKI